MWHPQDGGRYLGTGTYTITRDPDEGWMNCGAYRAMVHDKKSVGCFMVTGKHGFRAQKQVLGERQTLPCSYGYWR